MVRAFIAVDISADARNALAETISRLKERGVSGVRWVRPEGVHLTLKFLGDIDPALVDGILETLERAARGTGPLSLSLSGIGGFPSASSPRVIWAGLEGDLDALRKLQGRIDHELSLAGGFPEERRAFSPHLTLGRMRDNVSAEERRKAGRAIADATLESGERWEAREVYLVRSTLTPSGAEYDILGSRQL